MAGRPHTLPARWRHRLEYVEEVADAFARCAGAAVAGAHVSDVTTEATGPEDLVAAIEAAVPGSVVRAPAGDDRPAPAAADDGPLAALAGERRRVSLEGRRGPHRGASARVARKFVTIPVLDYTDAP